MDEWDKKFGPMYGYFVGVSPRLVVKDLELVKQVCAPNLETNVNSRMRNA
jgi:hypothetical protein